MSAEARSEFFKVRDAQEAAGYAAMHAYAWWPTQDCTDPAVWLAHADRTRAAAQAHDAARIAYFAAEQAARARAAELTTAEANAPAVAQKPPHAAGSED
jgi:hypothetical protein